jgi:hypothetical protein
VTLTRSQMKWCKAIRVGAVHYFKHFVVNIELLLGVTQYLVDFVCVTLIDFGPIIHLNLFNVLFSLFLLRGFLGCRHCHIRFTLSCRCVCILLGIASTVARKLICFLIIISEIDLIMLMSWTPLLFLGVSHILSRFIVRRARGGTILHRPGTMLDRAKLLAQFVSIISHTHEVVLWGRVLNL